MAPLNVLWNLVEQCSARGVPPPERLDKPLVTLRITISYRSMPSSGLRGLSRQPLHPSPQGRCARSFIRVILENRELAGR